MSFLHAGLGMFLANADSRRPRNAFLPLMLLMVGCVPLELWASRTNVVSYANWAAGYFNTTQLVDQAVCGAEADPDGDGANNLQEYAFAMNPTQSCVRGISRVGSVKDGMEIAYTRVSRPSDLVFTPWVSTDLVKWSEAGLLSSNTLESGETGLQAVEETLTLQPPSNTFFARIGATRVDRAWTCEILWRRISTGGILIWPMDGTNKQGSAWVKESLPTAWRPTRGDFDGNGQDDLLFRNGTTGEISLFLMHGADCESVPYTNATPSVAWSLEAIDDFDGDGKDDLLWNHASDGRRMIWFMNGGQRAGTGTVADYIDSAWRAKSGYFNDDNKADLLWHNVSSGDIVIWTMDGETVVSNALTGTVSSRHTIEGVGDFDGDGKDDILFTRDDGSFSSLYIWFMDGVTRLSLMPVEGTLSSAWRVEGLLDLNGDHKMDILFRNTSTGIPAVWIMDGSTRVAVATYSSASVSTWSFIP